MRKIQVPAVITGLIGSLAVFHPAKAAEYDIVAIWSQTGPVAFAGIPMIQGMKVAVDELNAQHFLGAGNTLKVTVEDDGTDRAQAISLIERYSSDPKVLAIMGPITASVAIPGAQVANERKIPAFVSSNSVEVAKTGPYAFRQVQPSDFVLKVLGRYAVENLKVKNCAVIGANDNVAYVEPTQVFQDYVSERGVTVSTRENIKLTDSDFSAVSTKIAALAPECVYISATAPVAANLIRQLRQAGLDPKTKVMGMSTLASADLIKAGGKAVEGVYMISDWTPGGNSPDGRKFSDAFRIRFGSEPDVYGAMGYSGTRILAKALRDAGTEPTRDKVRDALAGIKDFPTILGDGKVSYDSDRAPHYGENVLIVKNGQFVLAP